MRNLFRYLLRNHVILIFLVLEAISVYMVINYNNYQKVKFLNSSNNISASVFKNYSKIVNYFNLSDINLRLADENAKLRTILNYNLQSAPNITDLSDSITKNRIGLTYLSARVINNSTNKQYNYLTLDKGRKQGISPGQGVIAENGIVGLVINVSESFSVALSLLNNRWSISSKLKRNDYFGSLIWDGGDYRYAELKEIPFHVPLVIGDTIVTSGFSSIFPEGLMIGTIDQYNQRSGGSFYYVRVKLSTDFKSLTFVDIINNPAQAEIETLKQATQNE